MDPDAYYLAGASSTSGLYGIPSVIDSTWLSSIYSRYGQPPYWKEGKEPGATAGLYRISTVMGAAVRSTEGEEVAKVDDLVINALDGRILFLSLGDVAGKGDALVAVPFSLLSTSGENTCVLSIGKEKLAHAPAFKESDVKDRAWAENGYKFFGAQPSWTEESTR
jgi:sporulation protein YlmC with PRC-barrel domain